MSKNIWTNAQARVNKANGRMTIEEVLQEIVKEEKLAVLQAALDKLPKPEKAPKINDGWNSAIFECGNVLIELMTPLSTYSRSLDPPEKGVKL